jgi:hypothetical protein
MEAPSVVARLVYLANLAATSPHLAGEVARDGRKDAAYLAAVLSSYRAAR